MKTFFSKLAFQKEIIALLKGVQIRERGSISASGFGPRGPNPRGGGLRIRCDTGCLFSHFPPGLQSADFILHFIPSLRSPFWILPVVCSLHFTLSLLFPLVRSPQSAVHPPLYTDHICICRERFVFAVSDLYLMWTICIWCEWFVICCGGFVICCEQFEFAVSDF